MSNTAITRENVQAILDRNSAEAKRKEAALNEQERQLRLIINNNHIRSQGGEVPSQRPERPRKAPKDPAKEQARIKAMRAQRAAEARYCSDWYIFLLRVFTPVVFACLAIELSYLGLLHAFFATIIVIVTSAFSLKTFAGRFIDPCIYQ